MWSIFLEFCSTTNIHGIRYLAERRRHWSERFVLFVFSISNKFIFSHFNRLWWIVAILISFYFCGSSIQEIVFEWYQNPVKMSLTDTPTLISTIPFPAVTICPTVVADSQKTRASHPKELITKSRRSPKNGYEIRV